MSHEVISKKPLAESPGLFTVFFVPYIFPNAAGPTGLKYCLRVSEPEAQSTLTAKGCSSCFAHGIVFGDWLAIAHELPEPYREWSLGGHLPYLPAPANVGHFQGDCLRPRERLFRPIRLKRTFTNETEQRIWEARARNKRRMQNV